MAALKESRIISPSHHDEGWLEVIEDDRPIRGVFGDERPRLDGSRLVQVRCSRPGATPRVVLGVLLADFPREPPRKYFGNNVIDVELHFEPVREFALAGVMDYEPGRFELTRSGPDEVHLAFGNGAAELRVAAGLVMVSSIRSYIYDPFAPPI